MIKVYLPIFLLLLCSCVPIPHTSIVAPEIQIQVVDSESLEMVKNVTVIYNQGDYEKKYFSKSGGEMKVGPLKQWHYLLYIGSPGHAPFPDYLNYTNIVPLLFTVSAPGYISNKYQSRLEPWYQDIDCSQTNIPLSNEGNCSQKLINPQYQAIDIIDLTGNKIIFKLKKHR